MPVAAIAGAVGVIGGALISSHGASSAASSQEAAANNATNAQLQMYNQTRADQAPWRQSGASAVNALDAWYGLPQAQAASSPASAGQTGTGYGLGGMASNLFGRLGAGTKTGTQPPAAASQMTPDQQRQYMLQTIQNTPGYQFQFDQGNQAVQRNLAAKGLLNSGAAAKELTQYGQGYAQNATNDYLNGLRSMAGLGQTSANSTGIAGMNAANQIGSNSIYAGNAAAAGAANNANAWSGGLQGLAGVAGSYYSNSGMGYSPSGYAATGYTFNGGNIPGWTNPTTGLV